MHPTWQLVHAERRPLVRDLDGLTPDQWTTPSLCPGWTVHDVAAHLVDVARTTRTRFVITMARARFDFDRQNADGVARERGTGPDDTLARLRDVVTRTSTPPAPLVTRLVEEVVHGEDVRRPLGITHANAPEAVEQSLRHQARTSVSLGGGKQRIAGLTLVATDLDRRLGDGPEVVGTMLDLLLAVSGRSSALASLEGPGVEVLATR